MNEQVNRQRIFIVGMVSVLGILTLALIWPFGQSILLAVAVVVIIKPLHTRILNSRWVKGRVNRATWATIMIFILVIAIPVLLFISGAISQASRLINGLSQEDISISLREMTDWIEKNLAQIGSGSLQIDREKLAETIRTVIKAVIGWFIGLVAIFGESIPLFFTNTLIFLVIVFVMLPRYKNRDKQELLRIFPFPKEITLLFLNKIDLMIIGMFRGIFVISIVQGSAMGLVFWLAGVPYVMFLTLLSIFLSIIPLVGISLVAWPVGILLMLGGNVPQGLFVIVVFLIVVANIDTVLRPVLVPKGAYLNPALIILSVFGGLNFMGIIGALYGPVIMILLVTSLEVYIKYILHPDLDKLQLEAGIDLDELGLGLIDKQDDQAVNKKLSAFIKKVSLPFTRVSSSPDKPKLNRHK